MQNFTNKPLQKISSPTNSFKKYNLEYFKFTSKSIILYLYFSISPRFVSIWHIIIKMHRCEKLKNYTENHEWNSSFFCLVPPLPQCFGCICFKWTVLRIVTEMWYLHITDMKENYMRAVLFVKVKTK